jgi:hypothetical protein
MERMADELIDHDALTESESRMYSKIGLSEQEALKWKSRGVSPMWSQGFREMGMSLDDAGIAADALFGPTATKILIERGVSLSEFQDWSFARSDVRVVEWALDREIAAAHMAAINNAMTELLEKGASRSECEDWFDQGKDLGAISIALASGTNVGDVDDEYGLIIDVPDRDERERWKLVSRYLPDTAFAIANGLTPVEALCGMSAHLPDFSPPALVVDRIAPRLRRLDGKQLPPALCKFITTRPPVKALEEIGFPVERRDSRLEFLNEFPDALVFEIISAKNSNAEIDSHPSMYRIFPIDGGDFRLESGPLPPFTQLQTAPSLEAALESFLGHLETTNSSVCAISSRTNDEIKLLTTLADALLPLSATLRINQREAISTAGESAQLIIPSSPASWNGYCDLENGTFALGEFVYANSNSSSFTFIGRFQSFTDESIRPTIWQKVPALTIERCQPVVGKPTETSIYRTSPTSFSVSTDNQSKFDVAASSLSELFRLVPSLGDFSYNEFTNFTTSSAEAASTPEIVRELRPIDSTSSIGDLVAKFELSDSLPTWAWEFDYDQSDFACAPVVINGQFVLILEVEGTNDPLFVSASGPIESPTVDPVESWASLSLFEGASMVSGTDRRTLELLTDDIAFEFFDADSGDDAWRAWPSNEDSRLEEILDWLVRTGEEIGLDLVMYAAELLIGDEIAVTSEFDDFGSDTCECSMDLAVADSEIEGFLELTIEAGFGAVVEAIRDPNSEAAKRRKNRLPSN